MADNKLRILPKSENIRFPDGGLAEVTDLTRAELGDNGALAYRQVTYTRDNTDDRPACKIVFEVRKRAVVCASFTLSTETETGIRTKDLRAIKLDELGHDIYGYAGVYQENPTGAGYERLAGSAAFHRNRKTAEQASKRRKITEEFLQRVAEVHENAPAGQRLWAVRKAFPNEGSQEPLSERHALRYIAQARREGLIDG